MHQPCQSIVLYPHIFIPTLPTICDDPRGSSARSRSVAARDYLRFVRSSRRPFPQGLCLNCKRKSRSCSCPCKYLRFCFNQFKFQPQSCRVMNAAICSPHDLFPIPQSRAPLGDSTLPCVSRIFRGRDCALDRSCAQDVWGPPNPWRVNEAASYLTNPSQCLATQQCPLSFASALPLDHCHLTLQLYSNVSTDPGSRMLGCG